MLQRCIQFGVCSLFVVCSSYAIAAEPTLTLNPVLFEIAPAKPSGDAWDTVIGALARPDIQVTLMRHDEKVLAELTKLLVEAQVTRFQQLGQPDSATS